MEVSRREIEVKLAYTSVDVAREALGTLGAVIARPRHFEENLLFDRNATLEESGRLLRLRRVDDEAWLTFKGPTGEDDGPHKVRIEEESAVADPVSMRRILLGVGFEAGYRYQKYRTEYKLGALLICLDETPIGCFVELEGAPHAIDAAAARLGFDRDAYVTASYRELHDRALDEGRFTGRDLVFEGDGRAAS